MLSRERRLVRDDVEQATGSCALDLRGAQGTDKKSYYVIVKKATSRMENCLSAPDWTKIAASFRLKAHARRF